jgi:hypothetical protein
MVVTAGAGAKTSCAKVQHLLVAGNIVLSSLAVVKKMS